MPRKPETATIAAVYGPHEGRYLELVRRFPLRPVRSEEDLDEATKVIHSLIDKEHLSSAEQDYLDVITELVQVYEAVHYPDEPVSDGDMLRSMIDTKGVSQSQVAREARIAESTISEVLSGRRTLNRAQIGKLAKYFHVAPGVFSFGE